MIRGQILKIIHEMHERRKKLQDGGSMIAGLCFLFRVIRGLILKDLLHEMHERRKKAGFHGRRVIQNVAAGPDRGLSGKDFR